MPTIVSILGSKGAYSDLWITEISMKSSEVRTSNIWRLYDIKPGENVTLVFLSSLQETNWLEGTVHVYSRLRLRMKEATTQTQEEGKLVSESLKQLSDTELSWYLSGSVKA